MSSTRTESTSVVSDLDRRILHEEIDALCDTPGLTGLHFVLMAFANNETVDVTFGSKGRIALDAIVEMTLKVLIDQCNACGTENLKAMIPALRMALSYMKHLHDNPDWLDRHAGEAENKDEVLQ